MRPFNSQQPRVEILMKHSLSSYDPQDPTSRRPTHSHSTHSDKIENIRAAQTSKKPSYKCNCCCKTFNSSPVREQHFASFKYLKKVNWSRDYEAGVYEESQVCKVCKLNFNSLESLEEHKNGKSHLKSAKFSKQWLFRINYILLVFRLTEVVWIT